MEFHTLNAELKRLSTSATLNLNTALQAITCLCKDLQRGYGIRFHNGSVDDYELLNDRLFSLATLVCQVYNTHRSKILELTDEALPDNFYAVLRETENTKKRLHELAKQRAQLENAILEKTAALEQEQQELTQAKELKIRLLKLEAEQKTVCDQLLDVGLPALKTQADKTASRLQEARTRELELKGLIQSAADDLEEATNTASDLADQVQRLRIQKQTVDGNAEILRQEQQQLTEDIQTAEETYRDLYAAVYAADEELKNQRSLNERYRVDTLEPAAKQLADAKAEHGLQVERVRALNKEKNDLFGARNALMNVIAGIEHTITMSTLARDAAASELDKKESELNKLDLQKRAIENQILIRDQAVAPLHAKIRELEDLLKGENAEEKQARYEAYLHDLTKKKDAIADLNQQLQQIEGELQEKQRILYEIRQKKNSLSRLGDSEFTEEVDQLRHRNEILDGISQRVLTAARALNTNIDTSDIADALDVNLKYVRSALNTLTDSIRDYTSAFTDPIPGADT